MNPGDPWSLAGRRAVAATVGTAWLMLTVVAGLASCSGRDDAGPSPAKTPEPSKSTVINDARPLVYAEGRTIHYGDRTYDSGRVVEFVEATDDGFVYVTKNDNRRLWFTDGSYAADRIGMGVAPVHVGDFPVLTANPGSLVAWQTTTTSPNGEVVVYDTDRHEIVTTRLADSPFPYLVAVNGDRVYWENDRRDRGLMRFDLSTGAWHAVSERSVRADLATNPRMLIIERSAAGVDLDAAEMAQRLAFFKLVGRRLVAIDLISRGVLANDAEPTTLVDDRQLRLTVPRGYEGTKESLVAVQWLDDHQLVLFAYHEFNELPAHVGDFLACPVPTGTCRVVVPASETPYVPPGDVP